MTLPRVEKRRLALVVLVALCARVVVAVGWQHAEVGERQRFEFPDSESYWELGQRLATGQAYEYGSADRRVFRGPGYPILLAGMFRLVGVDASVTWARLLGAALGALTVGAVYWLAALLLDGRVALLAGAIVAVYPEAVATSTIPLSDSPFCLWMALELLCWGVAERARSTTAWLLAMTAGIFGGVASLTRPSWLLFTPLAVAGWWIGSACDRRRLTLGLIMTAGLVVTMIPWWARNWQVIGRLVPTTLQVGASLYDGLNPAAAGGSDMRFVARFEAELRAEDGADPPAPGDAPFEYRLDRRLRAAAVAWAVAHPGRVLHLALVKFARTWNVWPNEPAFRSGWTRLVVFGTFVPVVLLSIVGAIARRRDGFAVYLLLSPAVYLTALHVVFVGSLRYRQPAMLLLAILAAAAIEAWTSRRRQTSDVREWAA